MRAPYQAGRVSSLWQDAGLNLTVRAVLRDSGGSVVTDSSLLEAGIREWLAEEERQEAQARAAADSFRGTDMEAVVDLSRSAARHMNIANRIREILREAQA